MELEDEETDTTSTSTTDRWPRYSCPPLRLYEREEADRRLEYAVQKSQGADEESLRPFEGGSIYGLLRFFKTLQGFHKVRKLYLYVKCYFKWSETPYIGLSGSYWPTFTCRF